jgi:hypothetical protein
MRIQGLCSAFADGSVRCRTACLPPYPCSSDGSFQLGSPAQTVTSNGSFFACALLADGDVKCWQSPQGQNLDYLGGAALDTPQTDGRITPGAWHPVDLGTHR